MNTVVIQLLILGFLASPALVSSQNAQRRLSEVQDEIQSIQREIKSLESQLRTTDNKLKVESKSIENIDKQIGLTQDKIRIYNKNVATNRNQIKNLEREIDSLEQNIIGLKGILKEQVVFAYKFKRGKQFDWIMGSANFNDLMIRWHYLQKVSQAEVNIMEDLNESQASLMGKEEKIKDEINNLNIYVQAAQNENLNLKNKRKTHTRVVSDINKNKTLLSNSLKEKKESYQKLKNLIASLEKGKPARQLKVETQLKWEKLSGSFSKNKGRLNWPVEGAILHEYGKFRNPKLKTVLNNTGVDIRADLGSNVRCVFSGIVSLITYMSGFGNMIIVDHNDSYYTVYAHLDQILVNTGDFLDDGDVIGTVGESGSLEGPKLHLEIYGNNKTENPEIWLRKK